MRILIRTQRRAFGPRRSAREPSPALRLEQLEDRSVPSAGFAATSLVSNIPGLAAHTDPHLLNAWGFYVTPLGQFRVAANGTGLAPLISANGTVTTPTVVLPPPPGSPPHSTSAPNGAVPNTTSDFVITFNGQSAPAAAIFSTEDGTILASNSALSNRFGVVAADQSSTTAVYKGLAMGSSGGANYLYATDFRHGTVTVFDKNFAVHTFFAGQFTDPNPVAGFAPFNVLNVNGTLIVTYAKQDDAKHDDVAGAGNGFIDEFDTGGHFIKRLASGTAAGGSLTKLNSPWGMAVAPAGFGTLGGALLVGNFGDSHVSAFNLTSGSFIEQLKDTSGQPLVLDAGITGAGGDTKGLWGIGFGNGQGGAGAQSLFFAAGPNDESDGVFGVVNAVGTPMTPAPAAAAQPGSTTDLHGGVTTANAAVDMGAVANLVQLGPTSAEQVDESALSLIPGTRHETWLV
jgi:uncharacterized protein (TIGR03118 family)